MHEFETRPRSLLNHSTGGARGVRALSATVFALALLGPFENTNAPAAPYPDRAWPERAAADVGLDPARLVQARDYALTGGGSGLIVRSGYVVMVWGDQDHCYDLKSSTKSFGATALGLAIGDGKIALDDPARTHHPTLGVPPEENTDTGWLDDITIRHLATQTAGFDKPGGFSPLLFPPGTRWHYSDCGPNWLAECVTLAYRRDVADLMFERVFTPLGITHDDLTWRKNAYRPATIEGIPRREFGSGISANVDAMARIGYLYLRSGRWRDRQILAPEFTDIARTTLPEVVGLPVDLPDEYGDASNHYGLLWWNNADGTLPGVPRDAFWSWGLYDSLIVVIPSLDLVAARAGQSWKRSKGADHYDVLKPFLGPIAASVTTAAIEPSAPYPPSRSVVGVDWEPASRIVRRRRVRTTGRSPGATTASFTPLTGMVGGSGPSCPRSSASASPGSRGSPDDFQGINLPAPSIEQQGDGKSGVKASGMLMVEGRLYLWARNINNSRLAWSDDRGRSWTWAPWRFTRSFGCPTFLNFGPNNTNSRDRFVYVYSHDSDSAYDPADRMVLARVPNDRVSERDAYEFFERLDPEGEPVWTSDIASRGAVFNHPGHCYRSGITYNAGLDRYLWCQTLPEGEPRFSGGFGIYDAPEPWGPWTTVFFTERWDVGPGETQSFPTSWMSADGTTAHLVFSGADAFSVRRARLVPASGESP